MVSAGLVGVVAPQPVAEQQNIGYEVQKGDIRQITVGRSRFLSIDAGQQTLGEVRRDMKMLLTDRGFDTREPADYHANMVWIQGSNGFPVPVFGLSQVNGTVHISPQTTDTFKGVFPYEMLGMYADYMAEAKKKQVK